MREDSGRLRSDDALDRGERIYRRPGTGPITVMTQRLEPFIAEALDAVPVETLPDVQATGTPTAIRPAIELELLRCGFGPPWLGEWLSANVVFQMWLFAELTGADRLRVRLETIADDGCERFHVDNVRQRLLCTFRGPGTEYLDPKIVALIGPADAVPASAIRRVERGAIALLRGSRGAPADRPGLVHRSPRIEGSGRVRLLLVIDEAD